MNTKTPVQYGVKVYTDPKYFSKEGISRDRCWRKSIFPTAIEGALRRESNQTYDIIFAEVSSIVAMAIESSSGQYVKPQTLFNQACIFYKSNSDANKELTLKFISSL